jgi:hypothetical protein
MDAFWLLGFSVGTIVATVLLGFSVYRRILVPILVRRLPQKPKPKRVIARI